MSRRQLRDREFTEFVAARSPSLLRTAFLLCGDRHRAEDLVQITLTKLYVAWERVDKERSREGYARQILVRASIDESRRPWHRERPASDHVSLDDVAPDGTSGVAGQSAVFDELRLLPPRQRAAVVLRYWHDLSVDETAALMDCSTSAVKTQSARGLDKLRAAMAGTNDTKTLGASHE